ncbi:hypothetical protein [Myxacorys almedinensis]|uniref:Uncharacterized protein n=1 Tax=Myxacorys almedinensis A TaxID=2690445 RepID=A0A8J8CJ86_9CYAN|nr:hypothetical protein [Myxacorys almedinensis]NDJ17346.1 hypothetical protein [Myxacorys almedinensis A]
MDSLLGSVDSQTVLVIAAIAVAFLALRLVLRVLSVSSGLILSIAAIALALNYFFGISPKQLWFEISHLPQDLLQLVKSLG